MDVQLPDGKILKGVPDGTTKEQLSAKLKANGINFDTSSHENKPASEEWPAVTARRASEAWDSRPPAPTTNISETMKNPSASMRVDVNNMFKNTPKAVSALGDVVSAPVGAAGETFEYKASKAAGIPEEQSRQLAKDTGDVTKLLAGIAPGIKKIPEVSGQMLSKATALPGKAVNVGREAINSASDKMGLTPVDSERLEAISKSAYDRAEKMGGAYSPKFANDLLEKGNKLAAREPQAKAIEGDTPLQNLMKDAEAWKDKPFSLKSAEQVDKVLTNKITAQYKAGNNAYARELEQFQDDFRESMYNPSKEHAPQGSAGAKELQKATQHWAQMSRMRDLETIVERAQSTANPSLSIRKGLANLYNNKRRMAGFSDEEKAAIKKAADTGIFTDILRIASSRLNTIIHVASGGGFGSSSLTYAGSKIANTANEARAMRDWQKAADLVANRKIGANQALGAETDPLAAGAKP